MTEIPGCLAKRDSVATTTGIEDDNIVVDDPADPDPVLDPLTRSSKISQSRRDVIGNLFRRDGIPSFSSVCTPIETRKGRRR
jgi:hypothetical protein